MEAYLQQANLPVLYVIVGVILLFVVGLCVVFIRKSYRAGRKLGMSKEVLNRAITSSVTFTILPSISRGNRHGEATGCSHPYHG